MSQESSPPKSLTKFADEVHKTVGVKPTLAQQKANVWRMTIRNSRVVTTVDYKTPEMEWLASTLTIDGKPRKLARDLKHLAQFYKNTDAALAACNVKFTIPDEANQSDAPPVVQHFYVQLRTRAKEMKNGVRLSRTANGGWRVGIYHETTHCVEFNFARKGSKWAFDPRNPFKVIVENEDLSDEAHSIEDALRLFAGGGDQPQGRHKIGKPQPVKSKAMSVLVRNTTVIRN